MKSFFGAQFAKQLGPKIRVPKRALIRVGSGMTAGVAIETDGFVPSSRRNFFGCANDDGLYATSPFHTNREDGFLEPTRQMMSPTELRNFYALEPTQLP